MSTPDAARFLTRADVAALFQRVTALTTGGGDTQVAVEYTWSTNMRWARNRPTTKGDTITCVVSITRVRQGRACTRTISHLDDATLATAVQRVERGLAAPDADENLPVDLLPAQHYLTPPIWDAATAALDIHALSETARQSVDPVVAAALDAAGYTEVLATTHAVFNTRGLDAYATATRASYTETVRMPDGTGAGWAGRQSRAWTTLDPAALSRTALATCQASAHPVAIEPGRYTTILSAEVVGQLMACLGVAKPNGRWFWEKGGVFCQRAEEPGKPGVTKIGQQIMDARLTVSSDPTDPVCGYLPFDPADGTPHRPVTWVERGVLKALTYDRQYAVERLGTTTALPAPAHLRVSGGETSLAEMIATTERGIFVHEIFLGGRVWYDTIQADITLDGVTRNGLFLIEHGTVTRPIKNMWANMSLLALFNQVLQVGVSEGIMGFNVAPPLKIQDFEFVRLTDAV